jgi:hypothetical protein
MSNFNDLQNQYNSVLTQYQQTYQYYLQGLDPSSSNSSNTSFVTVPNASFWGQSAISSQQFSNINDCLNSCTSTSSCSGATYNNTSQKCSLRQGTGDVISSKSGTESAIVPASLQYSYQLKNLNQQLLDLNQQMTTSLQQSYNNYQTSVQPQQQQKQILTNNHGILQEDREKIGLMIREFQMLNEADDNSKIVVTQEYSRYIVYLLVAILLIVLVLKFSIFSGEQRGGGSSKHFYKDFFILLGIYFFGFMILQYLKKVNIYTILSLFVIMYFVLLGMKR